ncbi:hypothetical protein ACFZCK_23690 [Kitasatospora purpeofusca]|uniref:hypothetical protein n=1 Tax=Kitasatospora purpeofusca TaxID=67352 RepID=UPI0036E8F7CD
MITPRSEPLRPPVLLGRYAAPYGGNGPEAGAQLLGDFPGSRRVDWTSLLLVFV